MVANRIVCLGNVIRVASPRSTASICAGPRRSALDEAIVDTALAAGAEGRLGERVVDLIGNGTDEDPVTGVVLENGDSVRASGSSERTAEAHRRRETWAREAAPAAGEFAFLFAYWSGIPDNGYMTLLAGEDVVGNRWAIEDGLHMLIAGGNADLTKGTKDERHRRYLETLRLAPELIEPEVLDKAELVSEITVAPESLMRGFFRRPSGPGGHCSATPVTSSTPPRRRESTTRSSRRSTSPRSSPPPTGRSTDTRPGATRAPPSTTTGPSPGGASPSRRPPDHCSGAGRPSQMRARTCATPSVARWSHLS